MYNTGDTSGTNYKTKRSYSGGKREKCVLHWEASVSLWRAFFLSASKKGDSNALTSDSPFALCFSTGLACCMYILTFFVGFRSMVTKKTKIKKNLFSLFTLQLAFWEVINCFLASCAWRAICWDFLIVTYQMPDVDMIQSCLCVYWESGFGLLCNCHWHRLRGLPLSGVVGLLLEVFTIWLDTVHIYLNSECWHIDDVVVSFDLIRFIANEVDDLHLFFPEICRVQPVDTIVLPMSYWQVITRESDFQDLDPLSPTIPPPPTSQDQTHLTALHLCFSPRHQ